MGVGVDAARIGSERFPPSGHSTARSGTLRALSSGKEGSMTTKLVPLDRAVRIGAGLFLLATPILDLKTFPYNLLGIIPLATAFAGFCPLYAVARLIFPKRAGGTTMGARPLARHRPAPS